MYLSPAFQNYTVPFSQRSCQQGSPYNHQRFPPEVKRNNENHPPPFIWWTNEEIRDSYGSERVDLDLSAAIFDENWKYLKHISYTNLRSADFGSYHSGDITNGGDVNGDGACELVYWIADIDAVTKNGGRIWCIRYTHIQEHLLLQSSPCHVWMDGTEGGWRNRRNFENQKQYSKSLIYFELLCCNPGDLRLCEER